MHSTQSPSSWLIVSASILIERAEVCCQRTRRPKSGIGYGKDTLRDKE